MDSGITLREIAFDTETTGLDVGIDRIIELGCVELINHIPSGRRFQAYVNPDRSISIEAFRVHGLSDDFLSRQVRFAEVVDDFLAFVGDAPLIAHNAEFDLSFLNAELARIGRPAWDSGRMVDSLALARRRHPAGPNSLDALCGRYGVDLTRRTFHGALLDASLLAEVYIELLGGRQTSLMLDEGDRSRFFRGLSRPSAVAGPRPEPRPIRVTGAETMAHRSLTARLAGGGMWARYLVADAAE